MRGTLPGMVEQGGRPAPNRAPIPKSLTATLLVLAGLGELALGASPLQVGLTEVAVGGLAAVYHYRHRAET